MKYLKRAAKYFVYLLVILFLIITALVAFKVVDADIRTMFVNGYDSLWQIALIMAALAAVYPRFGFSSRSVMIPGSNEEILPTVKEVMDNHGYKLTGQDADGNLKFRKRAPLTRMFKMGEDTLTFTRTGTGYQIEGITKDLVRIVSSLDYRYRPDE